jgi:hypothetical protein
MWDNPIIEGTHGGKTAIADVNTETIDHQQPYLGIEHCIEHLSPTEGTLVTGSMLDAGAVGGELSLMRVEEDCLSRGVGQDSQK